MAIFTITVQLVYIKYMLNVKYDVYFMFCAVMRLMEFFYKKALKSSPRKVNMSFSTIFEAVVLSGTGDHSICWHSECRSHG